MTGEAPLFDGTRKALAFALNYGGSIPRPAMTRAMAAAPGKKPSRRAARARREALAAQGIDDPAEAPRRSFMGVRLPTGLEAAYLAGTILRHFETLGRNEQLVIVAGVVRPRHPCGCRSACCSGWRANPRWMAAVAGTIELLRTGADVVGIDPSRPGRGLSTQPGLRKALVEGYFLGLEDTAADLGARHGVSRDTASKHRQWIWQYLDALSDQAWQAADRLFDAAALVGVADVLAPG